MGLIVRKAAVKIQGILERGKSVLMLGPRQTGKTTIVRSLSTDLYINLARPSDRLRYEGSTELLEREILVLPHKKKLPLIALDEIQKVPKLLDLVQDLIDRKIAQFVITGSSARKLRRHLDLNLLPGRVIESRIDPLTLSEWPEAPSLDNLLINGSLPEIVTTADQAHQDELLASYVSTYLEEEIRQEATVRKLSSFIRFLELAASEAGGEMNALNLSRELGVAQTTVRSYFEILVDCLIAERIDPLIVGSTRRRLAKSPRYLFFDMGVRRLAAREGRDPNRGHLGKLFEQWVGIELIRMLRDFPQRPKLFYWRDYDGPEVDWVVQFDGAYIPIEAKLNEHPRKSDARHLNVFLDEHHNSKHGFIVSTTPRAFALDDRVTVLPWQDLAKTLSKK